jgi:hypothetical protein
MPVCNLLATAIEMLPNHKQLTIQDADVAELALENFRKRPAVSFSGSLFVEIVRKSGHLPLGTFCRKTCSIYGSHLRPVRRLLESLGHEAGRDPVVEP